MAKMTITLIKSWCLKDIKSVSHDKCLSQGLILQCFNSHSILFLLESIRIAILIHKHNNLNKISNDNKNTPCKYIQCQ
jgi:hypothetical protein